MAPLLRVASRSSLHGGMQMTDELLGGGTPGEFFRMGARGAAIDVECGQAGLAQVPGIGHDHDFHTDSSTVALRGELEASRQCAQWMISRVPSAVSASGCHN